MTETAKEMHPIIFNKRSIIRCCAVTLALLSLCFMYLSKNTKWNAIVHAYKIKKNSTHLTQFTNLGTERAAERPGEEILSLKRINIVILSLPRSGSSFLGDVFNHHPRVLYLFEPLHSLQLNIRRNSLFEFDFSSASYRSSAFKFLEGAMFCNFSGGNFAKNIFVKDRYRSLALTSPPFCVKNETSLVCNKVKTHELEASCKNNYSVVTMKILTPRIPIVHGNRQLLPSCSSSHSSECRIIHLVRDPRAVVDSMIRLKFFRRRWEPRRQKEWFVEKICRQLEADVTTASLTRNLLGARYKLIRFEELALHPVSVVNELFRFAGLDLLNSVKIWLLEATHFNGTAQNGIRAAFRTARDSEKIVSKWRTNMDSSTVRMIEKHCGGVMSQLGYKRTGTSLEKQLNLNISLFD